MTHPTGLIDGLPAKGSIWADTDSGYLYQYRGICQEEPFENQLEFKSFDWKTQTASKEGGLWLGRTRFHYDMVPVEGLAKHPCCGQPTVFPIVWCDDCGYEVWNAARDAKENAA